MLHWTTMYNIVYGCYIFLLSALVISSVSAHSCTDWDSEIHVCTPSSSFIGTLQLHDQIFMLSKHSTSFIEEEILDEVVWTAQGEILSPLDGRTIQLKDILYLKFDHMMPLKCTTNEFVSNLPCCDGVSECLPNPNIWQYIGEDLAYIMITNTTSVYSISVWNLTTNEWLQSIFFAPEPGFECNRIYDRPVLPCLPYGIPHYDYCGGPTPVDLYNPQSPCAEPSPNDEPSESPSITSPSTAEPPVVLEEPPAMINEPQAIVEEPTVINEPTDTNEPDMTQEPPSIVNEPPPTVNEPITPGGSPSNNAHAPPTTSKNSPSRSSAQRAAGIAIGSIFGVVASVALLSGLGFLIYRRVRMGRYAPMPTMSSSHENPLYTPNPNTGENPLYKPNINMDPTRRITDPVEKVSVARKMYLFGFACLPWLWMVNYLMFRKELLKPSVPHELKVYASRSLLLSLASLCVILFWFILYQTSWHRWGTFGERLAVNIPKGGR